MNNKVYYGISLQPSNTKTIFSLLDCTLILQFLTKSPKIKAQNLKIELVQLVETWVCWQVFRESILYTCSKFSIYAGFSIISLVELVYVASKMIFGFLRSKLIRIRPSSSNQSMFNTNIITVSQTLNKEKAFLYDEK